jgi:L-asparagine transporter-like permease
LAASEAREPKVTIPKAIRMTVIILIPLFIASISILLPLIPTADVNESSSPMVAVLDRNGISWAGTALNIVLITAILSTMLASVFGLGRILRSLADDGLAPRFLEEKSDVPYRGIIFSGFAMLAGLGLGLLFPRVYLFLVSSGGFAILFTYAVIMATHMRLRKKCGCPPDGKCQLWGYPYTSLIVLIILIAAIFSMPFVAGQTSGLIAGIILVIFFTGTYTIIKYYKTSRAEQTDKKFEKVHDRGIFPTNLGYSAEFSKGLSEFEDEENRKNEDD